MILKVISAEDVLFEGEVDSVMLPGAKGSFTVLHNHASLISTLTPGTISYRHGAEDGAIDIAGGLVDVDDNVVSVCRY